MTFSSLDNSHCLGRIPYPFPNTKKLMIIAVGVGIAPFLQTLRYFFRDYERRTGTSSPASPSSPVVDPSEIECSFTDDQNESSLPSCSSVDQIVLFYGVVSVLVILYSNFFLICFMFYREQ
jgi:hypothetical protein